MAVEYSYPLVQTVEADENVLFLNGDRCCKKGLIMHTDNSGVFRIKGVSNRCKTIYKVHFNANIAVSAGGTVGEISVALVQNGEVQLNPTKSVKLEKTNKKPPQVLNGDEISRLLAVQDLTEPRGCRDKAMLELLYSTGIKVSEIIELNVNDINLRTGVLYCGNNKNIRAVPVCTSALVSVSDYIYRMRSLMIDTDENQALFVNLNGSRLTRQGFWKIIKGYAKSAKIDKELTPQILRHSFALHLLESGKTVKDIQAIMGHADISSTQVYLKLLDNEEKKVYN